jgi:hypothetical protein
MFGKMPFITPHGCVSSDENVVATRDRSASAMRQNLPFQYQTSLIPKYISDAIAIFYHNRK